jgi:hypothetical protein
LALTADAGPHINPINQTRIYGVRYGPTRPVACEAQRPDGTVRWPFYGTRITVSYGSGAKPYTGVLRRRDPLTLSDATTMTLHMAKLPSTTTTHVWTAIEHHVRLMAGDRPITQLRLQQFKKSVTKQYCTILTECLGHVTCHLRCSFSQVFTLRPGVSSPQKRSFLPTSQIA